VKFALVFALSFGGLQGGGGRPDSWFGPDKVKHFVTSAVVEGMSYAAIRATNAGHQSSLIGATVATVALGVGKEVHDRRTAGRFSPRDLAWNFAGAGVGALVVSGAER
jgi:putative lipoprotein